MELPLGKELRWPSNELKSPQRVVNAPLHETHPLGTGIGFFAKEV